MSNVYMERLIVRGKEKHGEQFDASDLEPKFARYWYSKERLRIKDNWEGSILTGTVGMTTGWKPSFILLRTTRSMGSSILLNKDCEILGVQQKGYKKYSNPY